MRYCLSGSPEPWRYGCLVRAMQAVEDLECIHLLAPQ